MEVPHLSSQYPEGCLATLCPNILPGIGRTDAVFEFQFNLLCAHARQYYINSGIYCQIQFFFVCFRHQACGIFVRDNLYE